MADPTVNCTDACGASLPSPDAASQAGWYLLQITGRWRCPTCARLLIAVNQGAKEPS